MTQLTTVDIVSGVLAACALLLAVFARRMPKKLVRVLAIILALIPLLYLVSCVGVIVMLAKYHPE